MGIEDSLKSAPSRNGGQAQGGSREGLEDDTNVLPSGQSKHYIWSNLMRFNLIELDQIWSDKIRFDLIRLD